MKTAIKLLNEVRIAQKRTDIGQMYPVWFSLEELKTVERALEAQVVIENLNIDEDEDSHLELVRAETAFEQKLDDIARKINESKEKLPDDFTYTMFLACIPCITEKVCDITGKGIKEVADMVRSVMYDRADFLEAMEQEVEDDGEAE